MKIHLVSDLHLEFAPYTDGKPKGTDVVIAAGDIISGPKGPFMLREIFGDHVPIIYIAGNHEFYGHEYHKNLLEIRNYAEMYNVHFLDNDSVEINGVTFVGGTLWSDYNLYGDKGSAMNAAARSMNDFRRITYCKRGVYRKLEPADTLTMHEEAIEKFRLIGESKTTDKLVVVSHMAPHPGSIHKKYSGESVNPYYASDLSEVMMDLKPDLWVHGHMHNSFDYIVGNTTRVVCNPRGYVVARTGERENLEYNPNLLIDI